MAIISRTKSAGSSDRDSEGILSEAAGRILRLVLFDNGDGKNSFPNGKGVESSQVPRY